MIGLDDVRVNQIGNQFCFSDKIGDELLIVSVALANDLDRDPFDKVARAMLLGLVNDAHAAFKDFADNVVPQISVNGEECAHHKDVVQTQTQVKAVFKGPLRG